jgi:L-Ala-D/L-Glu epimerase
VHFGGATTELETDMTVTTGSTAQAAAAARAIRERGIRMIKVKIGGAGGVKHDLARISAIREAAPEAPLIVDGNAALSRAAASELVQGLRSRGIAPAVLEQWLPRDDLAGMRALADESGWLVAADECVTTPADALRVVRDRAAQIINIKLMKAGVAAALDVAAIARAGGLGLMIGGNIESMLGMSASACFACGLGSFRFADLDTPLFMAENPFTGGFSQEGGRISVEPIVAGHGVLPR